MRKGWALGARELAAVDLDAIEIVPSLVRRSRRAGLAPSRGARDRRAQRPSDQLGRRTWHVFEAQIAQDVSLGAFLDLEFPAGEGDWLSRARIQRFLATPRKSAPAWRPTRSH